MRHASGPRGRRWWATTRLRWGTPAPPLVDGVELADSLLDAVTGADAAVIVTEWGEFRHIATRAVREAMATPLIVDGRNLLDPRQVRAAGFAYESVGRPADPADVLAARGRSGGRRLVIAVVLVGGEGTRLRPLTYTTPKPMLPIANRPFLEHQVEHLRSHGVDRIVLACGYKPDAIRAHFGSELEYIVEPEPLGTGGAIAYAAREAAISETFVACNGDVLTDLDLTALVAFHGDRRARMTIALHPVDDPSRYGVVATDAGGAVTAFIEKPPPGSTPVRTINAGTYVVEPDVLDLIPPGGAVSVEYDVFPRLVGQGLYALADEGALARHRDARELPRREPRADAPRRPGRPDGGRRSDRVGRALRRRPGVPDRGPRAGARVGCSRRGACGGGDDGGQSGDGNIWRSGVVTFQADPSGMSDAIAGMADQLRAGERTGAEAGMELGLPAAVVMAGMGGSAMGGELLRALVAADCPVPITRVRGFGVPAWAGLGHARRLHELLRRYRRDAGLRPARRTPRARRSWQSRRAASSPGSRRSSASRAPSCPAGCSRARRSDICSARWPARSPRAVSPPKAIAEECAAGVEACDRDAAAELGRQLAGSVPLIYGTGPLGAVAYRWKTQFNENAKMHAFSHAFPELGHNEIVGWEGADGRGFAIVALRDPDEPEPRSGAGSTSRSTWPGRTRPRRRRRRDTASRARRVRSASSRPATG